MAMAMTIGMDLIVMVSVLRIFRRSVVIMVVGMAITVARVMETRVKFDDAAVVLALAFVVGPLQACSKVQDLTALRTPDAWTDVEHITIIYNN